jgi:diaminohydroxyphosphoribosylaminopyrimidine deaminase/5-amino-6-(5-phosphoribosylamino)uracil reductase
MKRALVLARNGLGRVAPNPMVGALVLNQQGVLVGQGYHPAYGQAHAEVFALSQAGPRAQGGTLYVTLEPCHHHGKTPPCVDAVLASGVKRVVVAMQDPNPKVAGQSLAKLKQAGVKVDVGCMQTMAHALNAPFIHGLTHSRPFVDVKVAVSQDGYMGHVQERLMLSTPKLEANTMKLRAQAQAVIVGKGTWQRDRPRLHVRGRYQDRLPSAVLLDPHLEAQADMPVFQTGNPVYLLHNEGQRLPAWLQKHQQVVCLGLPYTQEGFVPDQILSALYAKSIGHVLLEGGARLIRSFARSQLIDRWCIYRAPVTLEDSYPSQDLISLDLADFPLQAKSVIRVDTDVVFRGSPWTASLG